MIFLLLHTRNRYADDYSYLLAPDCPPPLDDVDSRVLSCHGFVSSCLPRTESRQRLYLVMFKMYSSDYVPNGEPLCVYFPIQARQLKPSSTGGMQVQCSGARRDAFTRSTSTVLEATWLASPWSLPTAPTHTFDGQRVQRIVVCYEYSAISTKECSPAVPFPRFPYRPPLVTTGVTEVRVEQIRSTPLEIHTDMANNEWQWQSVRNASRQTGATNIQTG